MDKHPYIYYTIFLIMGIFLYPHIFMSWQLISVSIVTVFIFLLFAINKFKIRTYFSVAVLFICFLGGIAISKLSNTIPRNHYTHFIEKGTLQFVKVKLGEKKNAGTNTLKYVGHIQSISYKGEEVNTSGNLLLLFNKEQFQPNFELGNTFGVLTKIEDILPALNPHQFDYKKYLEKNYIHKNAWVSKILYEEENNSLWYKIKNMNRILAEKIDSTALKSDSKEFLKAFLLGDRTEMSKENIQAYSKAGVMHLIAISGLHIAFIFGLIFGVFSLILGSGNRKIIILSSLIFVWLFGCFVGFGSSVIRACLMITIYYLAELLKRPSNIYHSLGLSAFIILVVNPNELFSIGFQLSYTAVLAMVWLGPAIKKCLMIKQLFFNKYLAEPLAVTLSAQLGTLPLVLYYFHQFSILSIPFNFLIIPYSAVITYSSVVELMVLFLPDKIQVYFNEIYNFLVDIFVHSTYWVSSVEAFLVKNVAYTLTELLLLCLSVLFIRNLLYYKKIRYFFPFLICLFLFQSFRLKEEYQAAKKQEFIVFKSYKYPVLGFRNGKEILILHDKKEDLDKLNQFILNPYISGERVSKVKYEYLDYQKLYKWGNDKIQVLRGKGKQMSGAEFIVSNRVLVDYPQTLKKLILVNVYNQEYKKLSNVWDVKVQGAFINAYK